MLDEIIDILVEQEELSKDEIEVLNKKLVEVTKPADSQELTEQITDQLKEEFGEELDDIIEELILEEQEEIELATQAYREYLESGKKTVPFEQVMAENGLLDNEKR